MSCVNIEYTISFEKSASRVVHPRLGSGRIQERMVWRLFFPPPPNWRLLPPYFQNIGFVEIITSTPSSLPATFNPPRLVVASNCSSSSTRSSSATHVVHPQIVVGLEVAVAALNK